MDMSNKEIPATTPMLRQYLSIKGQYPDSILFFRLGDFYEMFFEDAQVASKILDIALTSRNKGESEPVPLCGVPYHACQPYIAKLLQAGKKVAICEQIEDPKGAVGIVKRDVIRIITPGMVLDDSVLESSAPNYLVAVCGEIKNFSLAYLDISTGEFRAGEVFSLDALLDEIAKLDPKEILIPQSWEANRFKEKLNSHFPNALISLLTEKEFNPSQVEIFEGANLLKIKSPKALQSAGALWGYACYTQKGAPSHVTTLLPHETKSFLILDESAQKHLELLKTQDQEKKGSLLHLLDKTQTPMGARKLRQWLLYPLVDLTAIRERQTAIACLMNEFSLQEGIEKGLKNISDLERLVGRIAIGTANARDLVALANSLKIFPELISILKVQEGLLGSSVVLLQNFEPLVGKISNTLVEDPPFSIREGGFVRSGIHPELDELRKIRGDGKNFIAALEEKERTSTGISSLKIRFNKVFGYYIEITHTHRDKVPSHYIRKQTLVNAERYITQELKEYEEKVLGAEGRITQIEYELFMILQNEVKAWLLRIQKAADQIAILDALFSLSIVASKHRWVAPNMTTENVLHIEEGRHPIVEELSEERFVPNDIHLGEETRFLIITGPNMAGKSTVMRQTALIVILAQMGSFVPSTKAEIGLVDRIFTRVGASDRLSRGESTFMVEMVETAHILKEATEKSLVIIDEIGRGTSTYDGMSIAWAVAEFLHQNIRAKTLFATHYHELIEMPESCEGMKNFNIAVKEWNDKIIFLRKLVPGGTSKSYGIEVAKLAGLPQTVVSRAKEVLKNWETFAVKKNPETTPQLPLFSDQNEALVKELQSADLNNMTPIQALEFLSYLKRQFHS